MNCYLQYEAGQGVHRPRLLAEITSWRQRAGDDNGHGLPHSGSGRLVMTVLSLTLSVSVLAPAVRPWL